ncbi:MAG: sulfate transporter CysZ, partial [Thioalkalivibrio sp.]
RLETLGFGAGTTLLAMVPVLNLLLVPAAVIGATHLRVRLPQDSLTPKPRSAA